MMNNKSKTKAWWAKMADAHHKEREKKRQTKPCNCMACYRAKVEGYKPNQEMN